ncbi:MAG: RNA methyltransferase [Bacteroidetes bacterium]|nr:RNA methyltransferase [Bacteroidota bacterium]
MLSNSQVKHINALKIKKYRDEYREFIAEGNTLVTDLIESQYGIAGVYAESQWIVANLELIRRRNIAVFEADPQDMERITSLTSPSPVLSVVKIPPGYGYTIEMHDEESVERVFPGLQNSLSLMLESISDPGNFGTMLRIADWFGIRNVICSEQCVELYNPKVVQASMGSVARVNVVYTDLPGLLETMKGRMPVYGTFLQGDPVYTRPLAENGIIVIGSEAHGISGELAPFVTDRLFIPSFGSSGNGKAESLNAAVAAAVVIAEFRRRII